MNREKVLYDSDKAAKFVEGISGWVSSDGRFFGDNEHLARWSGCTHVACEKCGTLKARQSYCLPCHQKSQQERYDALERKEWDGKTPLCSHFGDEYFFDEDSIRDHLDEYDCTIESLGLRICQPVPMRTVDPEYFLEDLHEDAELPTAVEELLEQLNKTIQGLPPQCWEPGKYAAIVRL